MRLAAVVFALLLPWVGACKYEPAKWAHPEMYAAAVKGDPEAKVRIGWVYFRGDGVPRDHARAVHWWELAAERGHTEAQVTLGRWYGGSLGIGGPRDSAKALYWCIRAAREGHTSAQYRLGELYASGRKAIAVGGIVWRVGVPQDC